MKDATEQRLSALHTRLFRLTGGRVGRRLVDNDMLLLTTTGRRSGQERTIPLLYLKDGATFVVVASWGGREDHPLWYENLLADPSVTVQERANLYALVARTATPTERREWWPKVVGAYGGYVEEQSRTTREIPIVFLEPKS